MARLVAFLPRLVVLTVVWLLLTAALTYAAGGRLASAPPPPATTTAAPEEPAVLVVPDVRRQAYVFAKGILEDAGFAWTISGKVKGFAANQVADQSPPPGTRVLDTGAPTIVLELARGAYPEDGEPEEASPYAGTPLKLADLASAEPKPQPARTTASAPAKAAPAKAATAKTAKTAKKQVQAPATREPDFTFAGQRPEPQQELPLPERARRLGVWFDGRPKPTDANVQHWLYQHSWIVSGALEGWWHGAEALRLLIDDDRKAFALWGIGKRSEAVARAALAEVEARAK